MSSGASRQDALGRRMERLSPDKRALLQRILAEKRAASATPGERIPRRERAWPAPLTFGQRWLWSLDRVQPGLSAYNIQAAFRVEGELGSAALASCLVTLARRHEALRTVFPEVEGQPVQVECAVPPELAEVDLASLSSVDREREIERRVTADAARPFRLDTGPLLRALLVRAGGGDSVLSLAIHHIVCDGWSMGILIRELAELYEAYESVRTARLAELPIQYADFARWQSEIFTGERLEAEIDHWKGRLEGRPSVLELPCDRPRPAVRSFRGASRSLKLGGELAAALESLGRRLRLRLFSIGWTAFLVLLERLTGRPDAVVGVPFAGRDRFELEGLIGFFVNLLPISADLPAEATCEEALAVAERAMVAAQSHQHLPLEKLVEALRPERGTSHTPFFQVTFSLDAGDVLPARPGSLRLAPVAVEQTTAKFDLVALLTRGGGDLALTFQYRRDLFDGTTIERWLRHTRRLLAGLAADPGRRVADLGMLAPAELQQLTREWNDNAALFPREEWIVALFEARARSARDKVAVVAGDEHLSYGELRRRARAFAGRLEARGVARGDLVALYLERSPAMVVAMLGVLEAGGAYVPLEVGSPLPRLRFLLEDTAAPLVVTEAELAGDLAGLPVPALEIDGDAPAESCRPGPAGRGPAGDLAYVIYTSGSTGRPKGVAVSHRAVARLVCGTDYVALDPGDRVAQAANHAFDAATFEIWGPLLNGGTVVVLGRDATLSPHALERQLRARRVSAIFLTTALFNTVARAAPDAFASVRHVLFGGEAVDPRWPRAILAGDGPKRLLHVYGPTECTTFATWYRVTSVPAEARTVPIGRGIANTQVLILDSRLMAAAPGVAGQLYLGGDGLARAYLGRPRRTATSFVPDPTSAVAGARLYATGDMARWLPAGTIDFLGRVDDQVKIRGFRIEPGEIESVLASHPDVEQAAVLVLPPSETEGVAGEHRLAAFAASVAVPAADELRRFLAERLPAYMVPATVLRLEEMPLNRNGKVDRSVLARLAAEVGSELGGRRARTLTPLEEIVAGIWADVLGLDEPGADEDFFELGGHSLLATQLVSRLREVLGVEIALRELFEGPTIRGLAERVESALSVSVQGDLPAGPVLRPLPRRADTRLPLSFAQQRMWFLEQLDPESAAYNIAMPIGLRGPLNVPALAAAFDLLVRRHEVLRTTFETMDGEALQRVAPPAPVAFPRIDLGALDKDRRRREIFRLAGRTAVRPFDLGAGPLLRLELFHLAADDHVLLLSQHHIVSDGWSLGLLVREVTRAYEALAAGRRPDLPELPCQYADFASWQREWLQGEVLDSHLDFWKGQLADAPQILELPTDRPRPAIQTFRGASCSLAMPPTLGDELRQLVRRRGATLFMGLLAGFQALLGRYTGATSINVGVPIAGRNHREVEHLIGFFINTLVLRADLASAASFGDLVDAVRDTALLAYAHQDLPFEKLVDELQPARDLGHSPLFQVLFDYLNVPLGEESFSELELRVLPFENPTAKFDLTLEMGEGREFAAALKYNVDLFDATTAQRLLRHFATLLEEAVAAPEMPLGALPLLRSAEAHQLLREWNDTASHVPPYLLHELLEEWVERTPERIAVAAGGEHLSYVELDRRAAVLAQRLRVYGVGRQVPVGLHLGRSPRMVEAILAVLKAGGAYVALDPGYPRERLRFMVEDAGMPVVLCDGLPGGAGALAAPADCRILDVSAEIAAGTPSDRETFRRSIPSARPDDLAYVIYTSGSTGRPKGVAIEHRSAVAMAAWARRAFADEDLDGVLASTSLSFDLSVFELFLPLAAGGRVILAENALELPELPQAARVTLVNTVPSAMSELVRQKALPASVRTVNLAGEPLARELVDGIYRSPMVRQVLNLYGPSEDTTYSTWVRVPSGIAAAPTIGRPVANGRAHVVDRAFEPLPVRVPGELYLGGQGLARLYLERPALTAERFVPDPFASDPGDRLYRTGDLARYRGDGELEFLGRLDHQVKIRGFRIELGEIEAALARRPAVREVAVVAAEASPGDGAPRRQLVAYLVAEGEPPAPSELRAGLRAELPEHMVPARFVTLEELPLTPNGKIDRGLLARRAAASDDVPEARASSPGMAPRTAVEHELVAIWRRVLRRDRIRVDDNFFELGGDSILSIQIVSLARAGGLQLTPKMLFQHQTIAELAAAARDGRALLAEQGEVTGPVPLTPIQRWFFDHGFADPHHWNQALLLAVHEPLEAPRLASAVAALVRHHDALRLRFEAGAEGWRQRCAGVGGGPERLAEALATVDLSGLSGERRAAALEGGAGLAQASLDLASGPLFRVVYFPCGDDAARLLLVSHHLVTDGVSWRILLMDLAAAYRQLTEEGAVRLPLKTSSFKAWAERLAGYAHPVGVVEPGRPAASLPVDGCPSKNTEALANTVAVIFGREETARLGSEVPRIPGARIDDLLLVALVRALDAELGAGCWRIDVESHGREEMFDDLDVSRTVGWFTALRTLAVDLRDAPDLRAALDRVASARGGAAEELAAGLKPGSAEVVFNYLGRLDGAIPEASPFAPAPESRGPDRSPRAARTHLLDVTAVIAGGELKLSLRYGSAVHRRQRIEALAERMAAELRAALAECESSVSTATEPDFSLLETAPGELEEALADVEFEL